MKDVKEDLISDEDMKKYVPRWVYATCASLMFLSVFINSIGLNLMQINGALTERIVSKIEYKTSLDKNNKHMMEIKERLQVVVTKKDLEDAMKRIEELEAMAHLPGQKK